MLDTRHYMMDGKQKRLDAECWMLDML